MKLDIFDGSDPKACRFIEKFSETFSEVVRLTIYTFGIGLCGIALVGIFGFGAWFMIANLFVIITSIIGITLKSEYIFFVEVIGAFLVIIILNIALVVGVITYDSMEY